MKPFCLTLTAALGLTLSAEAQTFSVTNPFPPRFIPTLPVEEPKRALDERIVSTPPVARWDWSMADRYGLDVNRNGTVDLPNSLAYVMNTSSPVNAGNQCTPTSGGQPQFRVTFDARDSRDLRMSTRRLASGQGENVTAHPPASPSYNWTVQREDGELVTFRGVTPRVCLPEGRHRVFLSMEQKARVGTALNQAERTWVSRSIRDIHVVDHLIVLLGDSFAAGEGAPEGLSDLVI
ncbi:MAG: hypothetical protein AAFX00_10655, partial [Pseudomonadota bacterium]